MSNFTEQKIMSNMNDNDIQLFNKIIKKICEISNEIKMHNEKIKIINKEMNLCCYKYNDLIRQKNILIKKNKKIQFSLEKIHQENIKPIQIELNMIKCAINKNNYKFNKKNILNQNKYNYKNI